MEGDDIEAVDQALQASIATALRACAVLCPGRPDLAAISVAAEAATTGFESPAAAFAWFDGERRRLVAQARSALKAGLPRRAWELAMASQPIHKRHFTWDDWSDLSEMGVIAANHWSRCRGSSPALATRRVRETPSG